MSPGPPLPRRRALPTRCGYPPGRSTSSHAPPLWLLSASWRSAGFATLLLDGIHLARLRPEM
eukprot:11170648-Lingulodinium_polyedra.AAC.1